MKTTSAQAISLMLAGSLCLLPFLLPYHQPPILSFFPEWLAAALGVAAALALLVGRGVTAVFLPAPARWLIAFAVLLAAQAASGAHANSLAGVIQFYGRPKLLEDVIAELHGRRAYGNIAQANLYANYLALGEGALLFLWVRARVRTAYALPALALLLMGSSLSGSRGALLYALWYGALGLLAVRVQDGEGARRLKFAACGVAVAALSAHFAVPWLNDVLHLGPPGEGTLDRILAAPGEHAEPRRLAWLIALRAFIGVPLAGVGMGEFAGAAFELGLDPSLTRLGEVWTSPHNLPLHLLAETGLVGTVLVLGGLSVWGWQAARRYWTDGQVALWWIIAAVGIEMIHSLTEFPLWNAHFLGLTALLMGAGARLEARSPAVSRTGWIAPAAACAVLSVALGVTLREYVRLDMTRISGTMHTLTPGAQGHQDAETMRELTHGLMAPLAELWIVIGAPLDRSNLADKLAMSERVARYWPANAVVTRRAVFLAFQGEAAKARESLALVLRTFPHRRDATILMLEQARQVDPDAIAPLIAMAKSPDIPPADLREQ